MASGKIHETTRTINQLAHCSRRKFCPGRLRKHGCQPQAAPATADSLEPGKGLVIFYRESHFKGGGVGFIVRDLHQLPSDTSLGSGPKIGALPNGSLFVFNATPGKHTFAGEVTSRIGSWSYRTMNIESNHVY